MSRTIDKITGCVFVLAGLCFLVAAAVADVLANPIMWFPVALAAILLVAGGIVIERGFKPGG